MESVASSPLHLVLSRTGWSLRKLVQSSCEISSCEVICNLMRNKNVPTSFFKKLENVGKFKSTALELNLWSNLFKNALSPGNFIKESGIGGRSSLTKILVSVLHPRELKNVRKAGKWRKSFSVLWHAVVQTVNVQQVSVSCISPPYLSNYISDPFCLGVRSAHLQVILGCSEQEGKSGSWRTSSWFMHAVWEYCNH